MSNQKQTSGDNSVNAQAGGNIIIQQGISATEARQIAIDVMKVTTLEYQREAIETINQRLNHISKKIVEEVNNRTNSNFTSFKDPDFQYVLNQAGVTYARSGDVDVEKLLVDLIGERSIESKRTTKQAVLNEALSVGGRLTNEHLKILAAIFIPKYTMRQAGTLQALGEYCNSTMGGFLSDYSTKELDFQHLAFLGCVTISIGSTDIGAVFREHYSGLFSRGFTDNEVPAELSNLVSNSNVIVSCLQDPTRKQFRALNSQALEKVLNEAGVTADQKSRALGLHANTIPDADSCVELICKQSPGMNSFFKRWKESLSPNTSLTSVGRALAISYLRSQGQTSYSFDTWLS